MAKNIPFLNNNTVGNINTNFQRVNEALGDVVARSGELPNNMGADLDMDGNDILNVNQIDVQSFTLDGSDVIDNANIIAVLENAENINTVADDLTGDDNIGTVAEYIGNVVLVSDAIGHAEEWAQSPHPISTAAGGNGSTDQSSKTWSSRSEASADLAAGYVSDAVSQGNVPIRNSLENAATEPVKDGINKLIVLGAGEFTDQNNGTPAAFTSTAGEDATARPWYITGRSVPLVAFGCSLDGATDDTANAERAAEAAIALGVPLELTGGTLFLSSNRSVLALADRTGWGSVKVGDITVPWNRDVRSNPMRYETAGASSTLREVVSDDTYSAFPISTRIKNGAIVTFFWHGNGHSPSLAGDNLGEFRCFLSFDGGATVTEPFAVAGNISGLDDQWSYLAALGTDADGYAVAIVDIFDGSYSTPNIMRSKDGLVWSPPVLATLVNDDDVIKPATLLPFGTIACTPSGKLLIPFYQTTRNWIAVIHPDSPNTLDFSALVVNSSDPDYNEQAVAAVSEREWYVLSRRVGVASPPLFRTLDGGASFEYLGQIGASGAGIAPGGGYIPQAIFPFVVGGETHLGVVIGLRKSVSAPIDGAPALMFAASRLSELTPSNLAFRKIHLWPMADDVAVRDAYAGFAYDEVTRSLFVSTHEETADTKSRILVGAINIGDAMHGRAAPAVRAWPVAPEIVGSTVTGVNTYSTQSSRYTRDGWYCRGTLTLAVTTLASEGNLSVVNFPYKFALAEEFVATGAYPLTGTLTGVVLRGVAGTNTATLVERFGVSNLSHSEVTTPFNLRAAFNFLIDE